MHLLFETKAVGWLVGLGWVGFGLAEIFYNAYLLNYPKAKNI